MTMRDLEASRESLSETIEELTLDIGRILHANTSTLLMVNQTLLATIETLTTEPTAPNKVDLEWLEREARSAAGTLAGAIERLCQEGTEAGRSAALSEQEWVALAAQVNLLREVDAIVAVREAALPTLRTSAHRAQRICRQVKGGHLSRENVRDVLRLAGEVERLACLADVVTTRTAVIQMDASLRTLRDFVTANLRRPEQPESLDLEALMREAVSQLAEFASASNVAVKIHRDDDLPPVQGERREVARALTNLLHNAIKYSWHRERGKAPWVAVRLARSATGVYVDFETWGVPITREEIEQGLVFQIGYRGKWSVDRGRLGTGIGLTDAQRVARAHGGSVTITSRPAHRHGGNETQPDYYRHPFITNVRISFALSGTETGSADDSLRS